MEPSKEELEQELEELNEIIDNPGRRSPWSIWVLRKQRLDVKLQLFLHYGVWS